MEGGPLDGQYHFVEDIPPTLIWMMPDYAKDLPAYVKPNFDGSMPMTIQTKKVTYYRELAEHYWQIVTYFHTEEARDRAYYEDEIVPEMDQLACSQESCLLPYTTRAYMQPLSVLRSSASLDGV